jgi:hypothetical protein
MTDSSKNDPIAEQKLASPFLPLLWILVPLLLVVIYGFMTR